MISSKKIARILIFLSAALILSLSFQSGVQAAEGFDKVAGGADMQPRRKWRSMVWFLSTEPILPMDLTRFR